MRKREVDRAGVGLELGRGRSNGAQLELNVSYDIVLDAILPNTKVGRIRRGGRRDVLHLLASPILPALLHLGRRIPTRLLGGASWDGFRGEITSDGVAPCAGGVRTQTILFRVLHLPVDLVDAVTGLPEVPHWVRRTITDAAGHNAGLIFWPAALWNLASLSIATLARRDRSVDTAVRLALRGGAIHARPARLLAIVQIATQKGCARVGTGEVRRTGLVRRDLVGERIAIPEAQVRDLVGGQAGPAPVEVEGQLHAVVQAAES
mmetsp:Transcript_85084/g.259959  ORF Transcript_85084/g.259959 Transcript_85084/m.259959 type:complete len:263 (-) Transcript_85084:529-1317(-)